MPTRLMTLKEVERAAIVEALRVCKTYVDAAEELDIDIATLYRRRKQLRRSRTTQPPGESIPPDIFCHGSGI